MDGLFQGSEMSARRLHGGAAIEEASALDGLASASVCEGPHMGSGIASARGVLAAMPHDVLSAGRRTGHGTSEMCLTACASSSFVS